MPHRKIISGLKKTRKVIESAGLAVDKAIFEPLENITEQQVLRRVGIGPIGTFESKKPTSTVSQTSSISRSPKPQSKPPKSQTVGFVIPGSLLAKAQYTGSATRRKRARVLARRLGVRSKTLRIRGGPGK